MNWETLYCPNRSCYLLWSAVWSELARKEWLQSWDKTGIVSGLWP